MKTCTGIKQFTSLKKILILTLFIITGLCSLNSYNFSDKLSFYAEFDFAEKTRFDEVKNKLDGQSEAIDEEMKNDSPQIAYGMNIVLNNKYNADVSYLQSNMTYKYKSGRYVDEYKLENSIIHPVLYHAIKKNSTYSFNIGIGLLCNNTRLIIESKRDAVILSKEKSKRERIYTPTLNAKMQKMLPNNFLNINFFFGASCSILLNTEQILNFSDENPQTYDYDFKFKNPFISAGLNLGFYL